MTSREYACNTRSGLAFRGNDAYAPIRSAAASTATAREAADPHVEPEPGADYRVLAQTTGPSMLPPDVPACAGRLAIRPAGDIGTFEWQTILAFIGASHEEIADVQNRIRRVWR